MFGKNWLRALRNAKPFLHQRTGARSVRANHVIPAAAAANAIISTIARGAGALRFGTGVICGGGAAAVWGQAGDESDEDFVSETDHLAWVQDIMGQAGIQEVTIPGRMLREHPVGKLVTEEDHLFQAMVASKQIKEFRCFYNNSSKVFYSVVKLGKEVCGYPATVHGGLTAAIIDESLGGLYTCMLTSGSLGVRMPALTARLEVDYRKKIPAGSIILVQVELDSIDKRKVWMRAQVTDGGKATYAAAKSLFVAPRPLNLIRNMLFGWVPGLGSKSRQQQAVQPLVAA